MQPLFANITDSIFDFCCQLVSWFAKLCGCTYYEMNTYLFIVAQPLIYVLLSLVILFYAAKWLKNGKRWVFFAALGYAIFNVLCFCLIQYHYRMDADSAARICIKEMYDIQDQYGIPYELNNFILFVFAFLAIVAFDWWVIRRLKRKS